MPAPPEPRWALPSLRLLGGLRVALVAVAVAVGLAEVYQALGSMLAPAWVAAAVFNTALAMAVVAWRLRQGQTQLFCLGAKRWYLPAAGIVLGSCGLALISRWFGAPPLATAGGAGIPWGWLAWVPVVEEVVFRAGLGQSLRRLAPQPWAAWFSAAAFALVHASPTLAHLSSGQVGLALGPFLLGLCCEALVAASGSIAPGILLHAVCNATVIVFQVLDERWLVWLQLLYQ